MCNACGNPAAPGHWTEAGAATLGDRLRARFHRAALLNAVLKPYGLSAHDGGVVPGIQVGTLAGAQTIVHNLEDLWAEAERLAGRPIDPLDPRYLDD
jgi:methyl coenzyme M reductase gamma subunit